MLSSQTTTDDVEQQGTITITTPRTTTIPLEESPDLLALAASSSSSSSMIPSTSAAAAATTTTSLWRMKLFGGRNTPNHPPRTVGLGTDEEEEEDDLDRINHTTTTTTTTTTSPNKNTSCRSDCPICLEEFDDEDDPERQPDDDEENQRTIRRTTIPECQHEFCQECLRTYCEHCIQIRKVPIPCPQQQQSSSPPTNPCPIRLTHETVQTVLLSSCSNNNDNNTNSNVCQNVMDGTTQIDYGTILDETTQNTNHQQQRNHHDDDNDIVDETTNHAIMMKAWQRYWKLIRLSQDSNLWECPHCNELVNIHRPLRSRTAAVSADDENHPNTHVDQDDEHEEEEEENDWSCSHCRGSFCKIHSLAHAGFTCREFRQTQAARAWEQTEEALKQYTQPCSHCGSYIQKYKGCDHVICLHCHSDMCWKCGTHEHLSGTAIRHCANCQRDYRDHRYDHRHRLYLCLCLPLVLPFVLVWIAVVGTFAIITGCFGCFYCCGVCGAERQKHGTMKTAMMGVLATLLTIFLPILILLEDFGAHLTIFDVLFSETPNEMPFLEIASQSIVDGGGEMRDRVGAVAR